MPSGLNFLIRAFPRFTVSFQNLRSFLTQQLERDKMDQWNMYSIRILECDARLPYVGKLA
jgi:hypothetical protein